MKEWKKYIFNKYEWVVELLSWRCLAAGGHLRSSSCCWCQLVLRILKVYRIDSTQDTFSIRLRSDMLSSLQWKLPEEYIDLHRTKKNESWIWKLEFKIQINQSASSLYLSLSLFACFCFSFLQFWLHDDFSFRCIRIVIWFFSSFYVHWKPVNRQQKKEQSFSVQITTRNRLQWISIASELYQIIIKKRETQKINNKYGFRCKKKRSEQVTPNVHRKFISRYLSKFHLFPSGGVWF